MTTTVHVHRSVKAREQVRGYNGCVISHPIYAVGTSIPRWGEAHSEQVHGGIVIRQVCRCGATRSVEANGGARLYDAWHGTGPYDA